MKFLDWYLKIAVVSAAIGASMELFMIKTGFCNGEKHQFTCTSICSSGRCLPVALVGALVISANTYLLNDDKVTVLESEKRAWESSTEAQAIREALNPWRNQDSEARRNS